MTRYVKKRQPPTRVWRFNWLEKQDSEWNLCFLNGYEPLCHHVYLYHHMCVCVGFLAQMVPKSHTRIYCSLKQVEWKERRQASLSTALKRLHECYHLNLWKHASVLVYHQILTHCNPSNPQKTMLHLVHPKWARSSLLPHQGVSHIYPSLVATCTRRER